MLSAKVFNSSSKLFLSLLHRAYQTRNFQVSVIGAASDVGSNVSLLLRNNPNVKVLNLYDQDSKVQGIGREISTLPAGPRVCAYDGDDNLECAIHNSHLILMLANNAPDVVGSMHDVARANSSNMEKLCKAMSHRNSHAFLAIATDPINIMVPYAYHLLNKYAGHHTLAFDPNKIFGLTGIDEVRARSFAADFLNVNQTDISLPVIGGHSSDTIVPLFSNIALSSFSYHNLLPQDIYEMTAMVRKCVPDAMEYKERVDDWPLSIAWSISDFTDRLLTALSGRSVKAQCFTANPQFGTRFFSAPITIGPKGRVILPKEFNMSTDEKFLLDEAIPRLHEDIAFAEQMLRKSYFG